MYVFDLDILEIGDIILTRSDSRISEMVRTLTKSQYSHAILYVGSSSIIDSDGYGVQSNNLQRLLVDKLENVVVLRLKEKQTEELLFNVEAFARQKIGTQYSTEEAKIAAMAKELNAKHPNRQFCTRFIAQAYQSGGIKIVDNPDYCVPEELLKSDLLEIVPDALREASEKEIEFAKSDNPLAKQREIHNSIFEKARELSGKDIQTFEQVSEAVVEMQEIDKELTQFISDSGYLTMMEEDEQKNPWHYDADKMVEHYRYKKLIFDTAVFFATSEAKTRERLYLTIHALRQINKIYPREYFKLEIALYQKLIRYSNKREAEALRVLKHY